MEITTYTKTFYDFIEMKNLVDEKLGFNQRDYHKQPELNPSIKDHVTFDMWHKNKNLPDIDPDGKRKNSSRIWFAEYVEEHGYPRHNNYMDFWHWQVDNAVGENFRNDTYSTVWLGRAEEHYKYDDMEPFQIHCQNVWHEMFIHLCKNGDDTLDIWVSW